ncbi:MAG: UDP-N-acetylglucosamine--LPS N-acetylglucosamine transferase [Planctomycetota bacterium]|nr:UDP-N-acetylglucosamine--LPS N-acetylglucosamine transferase [Planctomycetota bacterium]
MNQTSMKICLAGSAGGHLSQLLKIASDWSGYEVCWITTTEVVRASLGEQGNVHVVGECNRQHPVRVLRVFLRCLRILRRERPDVVISTGAAPGCMAAILGHLAGAKVIWLDSITNVNRLSLSGRLVRPFADLFLVQWPALARKYRGVEYVGAVI